MNTHKTDARATIRLGHSPDPDDAFMWWPLFERDGESARLSSDRFRFEQVVEDIETLNNRACDSDDESALEITGISCACYPHIADRYVITGCGASVGDGYGPRLVAREPTDLETLRTSRPSIAVPGDRTTAYLVSSLMLGRDAVNWTSMPFDEIPQAVTSGRFDAGVVIHESQLTFEEEGLVQVQDLGAWWEGEKNLPLPLGANVVRRDLDDRFGAGASQEIVGLLEESLKYSMEHRDESIRRAQEWARGLDADITGAFVDLYVNRWTLDYGDRGREAVRALLLCAAESGLLPECPTPDFLSTT
jgi:1,4-dihydroxy-6-naphthoate synthase